MAYWQYVVLVVAVLFALLYDRRPSDLKADSIMFYRQTFDATIRLPNSDRFFHIDLPADYSTDVTHKERYPMVFLLHGSASSPDDQKTLLGSHFISEARAANWLVVYPAATPDAYGAKIWNAGSCCGHAVTNQIDDLSYFEAVIGYVHDHFHGDSHAVALHGLSNGAFMCHRLACHFAGSPHVTIRAIAAYNGAMGFSSNLSCAGRHRRFFGVPIPFVFEWDLRACPWEVWINDQLTFQCPDTMALPTLLMNSGEDILIASDGVVFDVSFGSWTIEQLVIPPVDFTAKFYARANGCDAASTEVTYTQEIGACDSTDCHSYMKCRANTTVCIEHDSGHGWTSSEPMTAPMLIIYGIVGPFTHSFDPSDQTFFFFNQHLTTGVQ